MHQCRISYQIITEKTQQTYSKTKYYDREKFDKQKWRTSADYQNILTAGKNGPALLQDIWFLEKIAHFDREVIPERIMHAKGSGAYGTFTVLEDISDYTPANLFAGIRKETPVH